MKDWELKNKISNLEYSLATKAESSEIAELKRKVDGLEGKIQYMQNEKSNFVYGLKCKLAELEDNEVANVIIGSLDNLG